MSVQEQIVRQPEFVEQRSEQLLASVFGDPNATKQPGESDAAFNLRKFGISGVAQPIPAQQLAGFTQDQLAGMESIRQGIGAFQPFLDRASADLGTASLTGALSGTTLAGAQERFDPTTMVDPYMNQYNTAVIDEIRRQGDISQAKLAGQATQQGTFGGSRFGVASAELEKGILGQIGLASQRAFDTALKASMAGQESQQRRQLAAGANLAKTALTQGRTAALTGGIGQLTSQLGLQDARQQLGIGQLQQQLGQASLDVARRNELARQQEPFRRVQFASDILRGVPSGQTTYTRVPTENPFLQYAGLGIAGLSGLSAFGDAFPNNSFMQALGAPQG